MIVVGAPLRHGNWLYNTAVVIHGGRVLGVSPKSYVPTYREFYERRCTATTPRRVDPAVARGAVRPDLLFRAAGVPGLVLHVEVLRGHVGAGAAERGGRLAGATVLVNISGSLITVGRAEDRKLLARSASPRCLAAYVYTAAGAGSRRPTQLGRADDGLRVRRACWSRPTASPTGAASSPTSTCCDCARTDSARARSTTTGGRWRRAGVRRSGRSRIFRAPAGDIGLRRRLDRYPFVPTTRSGFAPTATSLGNIQVRA